jgi:hypothetical protein
MMRRLPKFVQSFVDRHGKPRFYFRRPGFPWGFYRRATFFCAVYVLTRDGHQHGRPRRYR